ncbi:hypothetical protein COP2_027555 [Malus domestica]
MHSSVKPSQPHQRRDGAHLHNGPTNGLVGNDPLMRQNPGTANAMATKMYEERLKLLLQRDSMDDASMKQRFGDNVGQILDQSHASILKSAAATGQPSGQVLHGTAGDSTSPSSKSAIARIYTTPPSTDPPPLIPPPASTSCSNTPPTPNSLYSSSFPTIAEKMITFPDLSAGSSGGSVSDAKPNASSSRVSTAKVSTDKYRNSAVVAGVITAAASLGWIHAFHLHDSVIGLANDPEAFAELRERRLALLTVAKKLRKHCQSVSPIAVLMQQQCGEGNGGAVKVQWCSSKRDRAVQFCAVRTTRLCSKETAQ